LDHHVNRSFFAQYPHSRLETTTTRTALLSSFQRCHPPLPTPTPSPVLDVHTAHIACTLTSVIAVLDRATGAVLEGNPDAGALADGMWEHDHDMGGLLGAWQWLRGSGWVAIWQFGSLAVWQFDSLAVWQFDSLAVWQFGSLAVWQFGSLAVWQ
jgi:hypothetical protein